MGGKSQKKMAGGGRRTLEKRNKQQAKERQLREQKPHLRSKTNRTQNGK
jgi:hypothetical protein